MSTEAHSAQQARTKQRDEATASAPAVDPSPSPAADAGSKIMQDAMMNVLGLTNKQDQVLRLTVQQLIDVNIAASLGFVFIRTLKSRERMYF